MKTTQEFASFYSTLTNTQKNVILSWMQYTIRSLTDNKIIEVIEYTNSDGTCLVYDLRDSNNIITSTYTQSENIKEAITNLLKWRNFIAKNEVITEFYSGQNIWIEKFVTERIPLPYNLQELYNMNKLRKSIKGDIILKQQKYLLSEALSLEPFDINLIKYYSRLSNSRLLNQSDLDYMESIIKQHKNSFAEKLTVDLNEYRVKLENLLLSPYIKDKDILLNIKKLVDEGKPLHKNQIDMISTWEKITEQAIS